MFHVRCSGEEKNEKRGGRDLPPLDSDNGVDDARVLSGNVSSPPEHRTPNTRSRRAGLTLIEVMLALVILGTGMVALVTAAGRCISVARQAKNYETARELLARIEVEKPALLEENVEDIAGSGSFDAPHQGFRWTRTVEQEGFEEDSLWRVETEVLWTEDKSARREKVVTLIYWPEEKMGGSFERQR